MLNTIRFSGSTLIDPVQLKESDGVPQFLQKVLNEPTLRNNIGLDVRLINGLKEGDQFFLVNTTPLNSEAETSETELDKAVVELMEEQNIDYSFSTNNNPDTYELLDFYKKHNRIPHD